MELISVDFEVFGRVQGVFFRKYTCDEGNRLGLRGWCRNTAQGTVEGVLEGNKQQIDTMKEWLRHKGSPQSKIEKVEFRNEKNVEKSNFIKFTVKK